MAAPDFFFVWGGIERAKCISEEAKILKSRKWLMFVSFSPNGDEGEVGVEYLMGVNAPSFPCDAAT